MKMLKILLLVSAMVSFSNVFCADDLGEGQSKGSKWKQKGYGIYERICATDANKKYGPLLLTTATIATTVAVLSVVAYYKRAAILNKLKEFKRPDFSGLKNWFLQKYKKL